MEQIQFPEKLQVLFSPKRYKIAHGGRGGSKSWGFARALLIRGVEQSGLRVLCCREIQKSIKDSVKQLLEDQIVALGLEGQYEILGTEIRGPIQWQRDVEGALVLVDGKPKEIGRTLFTFTGLRTSTITQIKSFEGYDIAWVEEAQSVSKRSWNILTPTIRKAGSEIWIGLNPELATDATYAMFVKSPPKDSVVIEINWRDNPWLPQVLYDEMIELRNKDYTEYLHVWEGKPRIALTGAIYSKQLAKAYAQNRVTRVPYQPGHPVDMFWDLGKADMTSIWFAQHTGYEHHIIRYLEASGEELDYYLQELSKLPYLWGTCFLPHDAKAKRLGSKMSVQEQIGAAGYTVSIVPGLRVEDGIQAARTFFATCAFDEENCQDGLQALAHYRYDVDGDGIFGATPVHDWASHGADAFRYMAIGLKAPGRKGAKRSALKEALGGVAQAIVDLGGRGSDVRDAGTGPSQNWMR